MYKYFRKFLVFGLNTIPPVVLKFSCFSFYSMVCFFLHSPNQYKSVILIDCPQQPITFYCIFLTQVELSIQHSHLLYT